MKIIKKGSIKEREEKVKCKTCKTVFTYNRSDVKDDWRDGDYVICPGCGGFINSKL
jgi:hypothetical protein